MRQIAEAAANRRRLLIFFAEWLRGFDLQLGTLVRKQAVALP